jgi:hypothetical protein
MNPIMIKIFPKISLNSFKQVQEGKTALQAKFFAPTPIRAINPQNITNKSNKSLPLPSF